MSTRIHRISLEKLLPHPDNPNRMSRGNLAKLMRNIEQTGRYEPLVVRPHPRKAGLFQIINGHCRREALEKLGHKAADVVVWPVDDEETAVLLSTLNRLNGHDSLEKKLRLLRKLRARMPVHDMSRLLPQTHGQLVRLLAHRPLMRQTSRADDAVAIPLVFFVDEMQRSAIESALSRAIDSASASGRATKRAGALTQIAERFLTGAQSGQDDTLAGAAAESQSVEHKAEIRQIS
jgi:ParB family chromosome partitioning protein